MPDILSIIQLLFVIGVIPLCLALYVAKGRAASEDKLKYWTYKNIFSYLLIFSLIVAISLELYRSGQAQELPPDDEPLKVFSVDDYKEELRAVPPPVASANWTAEKQYLILKFDHALYAWKRNDFDEAVRALSALYTGKDRSGPLPLVPSFVVNNNLACAYFKKQRNQDFKAYFHLQKALDLVGNQQPYATDIVVNISKLDRLVNSLD